MSLADYAKIYKETEAMYESKYISPKPGVYTCRVKRAEYKAIAKDAKSYDRFSWDLEIIDGELKGQCFQKTEFLPQDIEKSGIQIGFLKGALQRCGVFPPQEILDLPLAMPRCIGAELEVTVSIGGKTQAGKDIINIKFTKQIKPSSTQPDSFAGDTTSVNTNDFPF